MNGICIAMDSSEADYVKYAVDDLKQYIWDITGAEPCIVYEWESFSGCGTVIAIGRSMIGTLHRVVPDIPRITDSSPGEQGFVLKTSTWTGNGNKKVVAAGGSDYYGTNFAVIELIKSIRISGKTIVIPESDRNEKPDILLRGAYAHNHWVYNYPYCTRTWKLEDWEKYIDMLAYLKLNLLQIWVPQDFMPHPLIKGDREYLQTIRNAVEYARNKRGFKEVLIGACANTVCYPGDMPSIQTRDFQTYVRIIDPTVAENFDYIRDTRMDMLSVIDNATGDFLIDCDLGGWQGAGVSFYSDIFMMHHKLLTAGNNHSKLIAWNWMGWNNGRADAIRTFLNLMDKGLSGKRTWWPVVCAAIWSGTVDLSEYMQKIDELGKREDTLYFPYHVVEVEPAYPFRWKMFDSIRTNIFDRYAEFPGMKGIFANAQTQINEISNYYFFAELAWDTSKRHILTDRQACEGIALLLYPEQYKKIAAGFDCISANNSYSNIISVLTDIEDIMYKGVLGSYGPMARKLPGYSGIAVEDLILQLGCLGFALKFESQTKNGDLSNIKDTLSNYFRYAGNYHMKHGYQGVDCFEDVYGSDYKPYYSRFSATWADFCMHMGMDRAYCILQEVFFGLDNDNGVSMEGVNHEMNRSCGRVFVSENLASGKTATATSSAEGFGADLSVNDKPFGLNEWRSASLPASIEVDLGSDWKVRSISWYSKPSGTDRKSIPGCFSIQASSDHFYWTAVDNVTSYDKYKKTCNCLITCRYVKIEIVDTQGSGKDVSITELRVIGDAVKIEKGV